MNVAQETLGFRRAGLSPALSLLMSAFALPMPPAALTSHLRRPTERSPTIAHLIQTSCLHTLRLSGTPDAFIALHVTVDSTVRGRFGLGRG